MASITFTDSAGTWKLSNAKPFPGDRFAGWTPNSSPFGDSAARQSDGLTTMFRLRDDYAASFELPYIPSIRSNNEALRSEELDNAAWTLVAATIDANTVTAPDGSLTAEKIKETTANNSHGVTQNTPVGLSTNASYTIGASLKAAERTWALLIMTDKAGVSHGQFFNIGTGVLGSVYGAAIVNAGIEPEGNGWYRAWQATNVGSGGSTPSFVVYTTTADTVTTYAGTTGSGMYATRVQVDAYTGARPGPYLLTTSVNVEGVAQSDIADRLCYHLKNGGTCSVAVNGASFAVYPTCAIVPGSSPSLQLADRRTLEYTLSLSLLNVAGSPVRMVSRYAET